MESQSRKISSFIWLLFQNVPAHVPGLVSLTDPANAKVETVPAILYPFELTTVTIELDPIAGIFSCFSKRNE